VADSNNHRIQVFDSNGQFITQWGSQGAGPGQFQEPWGVAVDEEGNVYVADSWNHRLQKFDSEGRFLLQWGTFGNTQGAIIGQESVLYGPRDIAIDAAGDLYVTDTGNKRVVKFSSRGEFLGQWGGFGLQSGQFPEIR
jgi:DNA-binding beta-propeller fold protein YncE